MGLIRFESVSKTYPGGIRALDGIELHVRPGEFLVLIGPSGCGKTTALKMVNRLVEPTSGRVIVEGRDVREVDEVELRRNIGYVIQQIGLFPHLTIAENVGLVPRLKGWPQERRRARVDELLELVGLDPDQYRDRRPRELSGGQQQRVGVARALAADPHIVLMDEPFGATDPITRKQLQLELKRIEGRVKKTILFVTHDISEALLLGDRICLMKEGRIVQVGTPEELLFHPADPYVTEFIGDAARTERLLYMRVKDLAGPIPDELPDPAALPRLCEDETLPMLVEHLGSLVRNGAPAGFLAVTAAGKPSGYVGYKELVQLLVEVLGAGGDSREEIPAQGGIAHAVSR